MTVVSVLDFLRRVFDGSCLLYGLAALGIDDFEWGSALALYSSDAGFLV